MKIAILSNVTVEVLARELAAVHEVWCAPGHGAWREVALAPPAELQAFAPAVIYVLLDSHYERVGETAPFLAALKAAFTRAAVVAPDLGRLAADLGALFYDDRMWALARESWSAAGVEELRRLIVPHKAVAVDLDGVLWRGVLGEDGPAGVVPAVELQSDLKALRERGVLLTAISHNEPADVEAAFRAHPEMPLARADFAAMEIGWAPKSESLGRLAARLGFDPGAFVFIDDNPGNRAEMRGGGAAAVADFPPQLAAFFPCVAVTAEDRRRSAMYAEEDARRQLAAAMTYEEYLAELAIEVEVKPAASGDAERVAELSERTNQFNVALNRYSAAEVARLFAEASRRWYVARVRDRFGDLGLVAFVQVEVAGGCARVVDWAMSCRAMNRRIEFAVEAAVERLLADAGVTEMTAEWRLGPRNGPVKELFDRFGFELVADEGDRRVYRRRNVGGAGWTGGR